MFFPCEINAQLILLLPLAILSQEMSALIKKEKKIRGNKKGQVPGTSEEKKRSETRGKNGQVSDSRIRGTRYPPERKEKEKRRASHSPHKISKQQGRYVSPQRAKVELGFHHCYHHHHHTPFIRHTCIS